MFFIAVPARINKQMGTPEWLIERELIAWQIQRDSISDPKGPTKLLLKIRNGRLAAIL